jgi:hypothetical protein
MTPAAETDHRERGVRRLLYVGAITTCAGIAATAIDGSALTSSLVLGGLAVLLLGAHRLGRLGPAEPTIGTGTGATDLKDER